MDSVFVAHWFDDKDKPLVSEIDRILFSHGVRPVTGHHTGGGALEDGVKQRINESDCLIALATRRGEIVEGGWNTHPWVINEYGHAKGEGMDAIAIVEQGVDWRGMYAAHEYIALDRDHPSDALLKLSNTIGVWKDKAGESWRLQVLPEELAENLEMQGANIECTYRTVDQGNYGDWHSVTPVPEPGGVFLYVKGLRDRHLVEVRVTTPNGQWKSPATPKSMPVTLKELG